MYKVKCFGEERRKEWGETGAGLTSHVSLTLSEGERKGS